MPKVTIRQGDCISCLATQHGLLWETIWNHPDNSNLREERGTPDVLLPGDELFVPDKTIKHETRACEEKHRFQVKGVPVKLRLRILKQAVFGTTTVLPPPDESIYDETLIETESEPPEPEADAPYELEIDGVVTTGHTDTDGFVEVQIPPKATRGRITLHPGTPDERAFPLSIGTMDPIKEPIGVAKRLRNLGYPCPLADEWQPSMNAALAVFQKAQGLPETGEPDDDTLQKLKDAHGC